MSWIAGWDWTWYCILQEATRPLRSLWFTTCVQCSELTYAQLFRRLAMSGATMIACACKKIMMGKQSSLGPVDPQLGGVPAHGVVEEFQRAKREIGENPASIPVWQPIIAKYSPTLIGECEKAIAWSNEMTKQWLRTGMFESQKSPDKKIDRILKELGDHALTKSHARHLSSERCQEMGLRVEKLEDDDELQDAVLSLHHACMLTFAATAAFKIIDNHKGNRLHKDGTAGCANGAGSAWTSGS